MRRGHLFVIDGDLTRLVGDVVLVPTDGTLKITNTWSDLVPADDPRLVGRHRFDGRRVMPPVSPAPVGRQVWLGDVGRVAASDEWYAEGLVEFIHQATVELRSQGVDIPRLGVNVAGSGLGGSSHDKGRLFRTIVPALDQAAREVDADVVLVCFGPKDHAAAQRARRSLARHSVLADRDDLVEHAERLGARARNGDLVLFIGAGVSMGAGLPSWRALLATLLAEAGVDDIDLDRFDALDARDQAQLIARRFGDQARYRAALERALGSHGQYSLSHGLLAGFNCREAVTTNYDTLYETAARTAGRRCAVLPYEPVREGERWLLKLHGSISRPDEMVLTRHDYLGLPERAGALFGVLQALLLTRHMLFVGYSLTDDSFHKVMHEVRRARQQSGADVAGTALVLFDDPLLRELWSRELDIVAMAQPGEMSIGDAVRRLELFLDEVGAHAADVSSFLLDATYRSMLSADEMTLADALGSVVSATGRSASPIARQLERALAAFVSPST